MCIMVISMMKTPVLYSIYEYDKAFFIELFCVNKERPQMACNGQCKLAKMQQEKDEKSAEDILKQLQFETVYFHSLKGGHAADKRLSSPADTTKLPDSYNHLYSFLFINKLVKPPATHGV